MRLLFLNDLYFQIIEVNGFDEMIPAEPGFCVKLEVLYIGIQPYGLFQVKVAAYLIQAVKYHLGPGLGIVAPADGHILYQMVVFYEFTPHSEHNNLLFLKAYICLCFSIA